ncbi:hypothetical protein GCM10010169_16460 [Micromonospora fulviviridis]|uniref:hypothetical protein n=1 Tax=Micromonospora fulviviridis TaxID=47860 RepID=UPI001662EB24|nr:hypothetical protein [Micromonospora fulviviridis]GGR73177.1 hypothetical protein GCM10010169_16460 [Micromonospora fulviviridis]
MNVLWAYPRLPAGIAEELLHAHSAVDPVQLAPQAETTHTRATWYPTAPNRVAAEQLSELQQLVRRIARDNGWPGALSRQAATQFDRQLAGELYRQMRILPADAASEEVWSFLSLVLLPDVAFWRWPNPDRRPRYERILGQPRNVFRRLWHRVHILGADLGGRLFEDEAVGLLERPSLGSNPRTARAIAGAHLAFADRYPEVARTSLLRVAALRLRRMSVLVSLEALDDEQLAELMTEVFSGAVRSLIDTVDESLQPQGTYGAAPVRKSGR